jgi:arylsulfatase A-like enzyme
MSSTMARPNILVIMTDQQRRDTIGAYGCAWIETPNLDRLAADGTLFTACTVDNPICTPSRASMFTGKPIPGHSVYRVHDNLPEDEVLFTEHLQKAGYHTALFGKLHVSSRLQEEEKRHPHDGFDIYEWCLEPSVGMDSPFNGYVRWLAEQDPEFLERLRRNKRAELHHPESVHMSKWAADRTIDFIENAGQDDGPFFCLMSLFDPHDPYEDHPLASRERVDADRIPQPLPFSSKSWAVDQERHGSYVGDADAFTPDEIKEIRLGYGASIAFADMQIGRVLDVLTASGQAENTCVIFLSDHGDQLGDHGLFVKGVALYEQTVGVPLIVRWPGHVEAGQHCPALVQGHDLAATCLTAAGLDAATLCPESEDIVAVAKSGTHRSVAVCAYRNSGINSSGRFWDPPLLSTMVRNQRYKLILYSSPDGAERELFDLDADPGEQTNLSGDPELASVETGLLSELAAFLQREAGYMSPRAAPSIPSTAHLLKNSLK